MEDSNKDLEKFDALEEGKPLTDEQRKINDLDEWIRSMPLKEVGKNFTPTVIASAILANKRNANFKVLVWTIAFFAFLLGISAIFVESGESSIHLVQLDSFMERTGSLLEQFNDPGLRQFFLVLEGILCLIVIEKVASSFRVIKHAV